MKNILFFWVIAVNIIGCNKNIVDTRFCSTEITNCKLNIKKYDLSETKEFNQDEGICFAKSLNNDDIVISLYDGTFDCDFYILNLKNDEKCSFVCREYGGLFYVVNNNIIFQDRAGLVCTFDPYIQKVVKQDKPKKLFQPHEDGNDKRLRKYQFGSYGNSVLINRFEKDLSFDYKSDAVKLPYSFRLLSTTNGKTNNDFYMLVEKSEEVLLINYDFKRNKILREILVTSLQNDMDYRISSSPDTHCIMIFYKNETRLDILFYNIERNVMYYLADGLEKYSRFQDWDFNSKYVLFTSDIERTVYKIEVPN